MIRYTGGPEMDKDQEETIVKAFFEKRKPTKKDVLFFILIIVNFIICTVEYFTDLDLFWLFTFVTVAIFVIGVSIYIERKRDRKS